MLYKVLNRRFRAIFDDLYFSYSDATWTDDPESIVVQLRKRIVELVEGRISEIIGTTTREEMYLLAPGDGRYALARVRKDEIIEGTYFERGWPCNQEDPSSPLIIIPRLLEIRGHPYRITKKDEPQLSQEIRGTLTMRVE
jgi:hypothetical protein